MMKYSLATFSGQTEFLFQHRDFLKNNNIPGVVFTKGLSQVLGLSWLYFYTKVKPKTWLRPFVNTAPGVLRFNLTKLPGFNCTELYRFLLIDKTF